MAGLTTLRGTLTFLLLQINQRWSPLSAQAFSGFLTFHRGVPIAGKPFSSQFNAQWAPYPLRLRSVATFSV